LKGRRNSTPEETTYRQRRRSSLIQAATEMLKKISSPVEKGVERRGEEKKRSS